MVCHRLWRKSYKYAYPSSYFFVLKGIYSGLLNFRTGILISVLLQMYGVTILEHHSHHHNPPRNMHTVEQLCLRIERFFVSNR